MVCMKIPRRDTYRGCQYEVIVTLKPQRSNIELQQKNRRC